MDWLKISDIGNSKMVKSMMIWLFITPVFAKALSPISSINFGFLKQNEAISLSLPFSWEIFFFCALFFTLANIVYTLKCPSLIKKYKNYSDFEAKDNSLFLLVSLFEEHKDKIREDENLFIKTFSAVTKYSPSKKIAEGRTSNDASDIKWNVGIDSLKHSKDIYKPDVFSSLRLILSNLYSLWVWVCFLLYLLGFIGLVWVMYENIMYVCSQI